MPLTFPSHQGLVLPLWAKWPRRFNGLALCIGAAAPDLVDMPVGALRSDMHQALGHSLVGQVVLCVPVGWLCLAAMRRLWLPANPRAWRNVLDNGAGVGRDLLSIVVGSLSHLAFDLVTHGTFPWLLPWIEKNDFFPAWWYHEFGGLPLPFYAKPYPIAPHFFAWLAVSLLGLLLYVVILRRRSAQ